MSSVDTKKKIFFSSLAVLLILLIGLIYFVFTGKKPMSVIPAPGLGKPTYLFSIYGEGKEKRLQKPLGVAVSTEDNRIFVTDSLKGEVSAFDMQGNNLFSFKKAGKDTLRSPSYVGVNPKNNNVYVSDTGYASIFVFSSDGKFVKKFLPNQNPKFPWVPLGMAFDDAGNLYVADKGLNRIVKFDLNGKRLLSFGKSGMVKKIDEKPGAMYFPNAVAVGSDGDIYVSDGNNQRIQVFSETGRFKKIIGVKGLPRGIAVVDSGNSAGIYIVNVFDHQVQVFNKKGASLFTFGEMGEAEGQFRYPNDMVIADNKLFISDRENGRVQVWRF